jgi:hypothetical protein
MTQEQNLDTAYNRQFQQKQNDRLGAQNQSENTPRGRMPNRQRAEQITHLRANQEAPNVFLGAYAGPAFGGDGQLTGANNPPPYFELPANTREWQVALQRRLYNPTDTSAKIPREGRKAIRDLISKVTNSCKAYFLSIPDKERIQLSILSLYHQRIKNRVAEYNTAINSKNDIHKITHIDAYQRAILGFAQYTLKFQQLYPQFEKYTTSFRTSDKHQQILDFIQDIKISWDRVRATRRDITSTTIPNSYNYPGTIVHVKYIGRNNWDQVDAPQYYGQPDPGYYLKHITDGHKAFIPSHMQNAHKAFSDAVKSFAPISDEEVRERVIRNKQTINNWKMEEEVYRPDIWITSPGGHKESVSREYGGTSKAFRSRVEGKVEKEISLYALQVLVAQGDFKETPNSTGSTGYYTSAKQGSIKDWTRDTDEDLNLEREVRIWFNG